ncbi:MAG: AAA family ATPase [Phaeodactylibacter sp.]|nr:AAA family ATPase [Phaeodactylibacter sp.]MCB9275242.1 AAA family ATPase [Lewinellaceae bacterium]
MSESRTGKITEIRLHNFTCFREVDMAFSPGINVFIGENGTGKTHLLKVLFSFLRGLSFPHIERNDTGLTLNTTAYRLEKHIKAIFKVEELSELVSKGESDAQVHVLLQEKGTSLQITKGEEPNVSSELAMGKEAPTVYIPPSEMLSWYEGFVAAYENRESSIDETFYLLAKSLSLLPLKGEKRQEAQQLVKELSQLTDVKNVSLERGHFVIGLSDGQSYQAPMVAQGLNKIAQVIFLVLNGSIRRDTLLFWDEPETNLNPKYITLLANFIQALARSGVQLFVSTHDYLLAHQLSLYAEYSSTGNGTPCFRFFSLYKGGDGGTTQVDAGATLSELEHNPILEEYASLQDRELDLFQKSLK